MSEVVQEWVVALHDSTSGCCCHEHKYQLSKNPDYVQQKNWENKRTDFRKVKWDRTCAHEIINVNKNQTHLHEKKG